MGNSDSAPTTPPKTRKVMTHQGIVEQVVPDVPSSAAPEVLSESEKVWGRATTFSKIINPELHMKPNRSFGVLGTITFIGIMGYLAVLKSRETPVEPVNDRKDETSK